MNVTTNRRIKLPHDGVVARLVLGLAFFSSHLKCSSVFGPFATMTVLTSTPAVVVGVGSVTSTLVPSYLASKSACHDCISKMHARTGHLIFTLMSRVMEILLPSSCTWGVMRKGKITSISHDNDWIDDCGGNRWAPCVVRYFINSNSPSGGMKLHVHQQHMTYCMSSWNT